METSNFDGPPVSYIFQLSLGGKEDNDSISFQELSGISIGINTEEIDSGGENRFKYRVPGAVKYDKLVLKRGLASKDSALTKWILKTLNSDLASSIITKNLTISLLDQSGKVIMSWDFISAYPVKWEVSDFKSMESEVAIENLEFAYNYFLSKNGDFDQRNTIV